MGVVSPLFAFDWNGTLLADARLTWKSTCALLNTLGHETISWQKYRDAYEIPINRFYQNIGLEFHPNAPHWQRARDVFYENYLSLSATARLRRGAREALMTLKKNGARTAIISNHVVPDIMSHLERLKIADLVDDVLAYESFERHFDGHTKQQRLHGYMEKHRLAPQDVTIIGDTEEEIIIAHQLGLTGMAITDGHMSTPRLQAARPHYLISHLREVVDVARQRGHIRGDRGGEHYAR